MNLMENRWTLQSIVRFEHVLWMDEELLADMVIAR